MKVELNIESVEVLAAHPLEDYQAFVTQKVSEKVEENKTHFFLIGENCFILLTEDHTPLAAWSFEGKATIEDFTHAEGWNYGGFIKALGSAEFNLAIDMNFDWFYVIERLVNKIDSIIAIDSPLSKESDLSESQKQDVKDSLETIQTALQEIESKKDDMTTLSDDHKVDIRDEAQMVYDSLEKIWDSWNNKVIVNEVTDPSTQTSLTDLYEKMEEANSKIEQLKNEISTLLPDEESSDVEEEPPVVEETDDEPGEDYGEGIDF